RFQGGKNVLDEVELLVTGLHREILALGGLICTLGTKRGIGQDHVIAFTAIRLVYGVPEVNLGFQVVQKEVHHCQPTGAGYQFLPEVRLLPDALDVLTLQCAFSLSQQPFIGDQEKTTRATCGVGNLEINRNSWVRLHYPDNRLDQDTGGEVLPCTLLTLT